MPAVSPSPLLCCGRFRLKCGRKRRTVAGELPRECRGYGGSFKGRKRKGHSTVVTSFCFPLLLQMTVWFLKFTIGLLHTVSLPSPQCGANAGSEAGLVCVESCWPWLYVGAIIDLRWIQAGVESLSYFNGIQHWVSCSSLFQGSLYRGFSLEFFSSK